MSALSVARVRGRLRPKRGHTRQEVEGSVHAQTSEIHFQFSSSSAPDHLFIPSILSPSLTETPLTVLLRSTRGTEQMRVCVSVSGFDDEEWISACVDRKEKNIPLANDLSAHSCGADVILHACLVQCYRLKTF